MNKYFFYISVLIFTTLSLNAAGDPRSQLDQQKVEAISKQIQDALDEYTKAIAVENTAFTNSINALQTQNIKPEELQAKAEPLRIAHAQKLQDLQDNYKKKVQAIQNK